MKCDDGFEWLKKKVFGHEGLAEVVDYHENFIGKLLDGQTVEPQYDAESGSYLYELPENTKKVFVKGTLDGNLATVGYVEFQDANGKMFARGSVGANKKHWMLDALFVYDVQTGTVADYGFYAEQTAETLNPTTPYLVSNNLTHYIMLDPHDFNAMIIKVPAGLENNLTLSAYPN